MPDTFDPTLPLDDPLPGEVKNAGAPPKNKKELDEDEKVRKAIAAVYTFVRSQEINRNIQAFTFDHYIDEAKRKLKGDGVQMRDAAGKVVDTRPPQLEALNKLKDDFIAVFEKAKQMAQKADSGSKA